MNKYWSDLWFWLCVMYVIGAMTASLKGSNALQLQLLICIAAYSLHRRLDKQE